MKNFLNKVQELGKKAAEIKEVVQSVPAKAAELREAVTMTAGELQQLRSDVQSNLNGLRAHNEEHLLRAMREINDASLIFEEAGYELTGMDLDLSLSQRLSVHLTKFKDVPHAALRVLVAKEKREAIRSILSGILKAEETAANVELTYLHLDGIIVHVGAVPLIRMCWRSDTAAAEQQVVSTAVPVATPVSPTPAPTVSPTSSTIGSFFEQRTVPLPRVTSAQSPSVPGVSTIAQSPTDESVPAPSVKPETAAASPWSRSALDRFKKMPDLSKHRS